MGNENSICTCYDSQVEKQSLESTSMATGKNIALDQVRTGKHKSPSGFSMAFSETTGNGNYSKQYNQYSDSKTSDMTYRQ